MNEEGGLMLRFLAALAAVLTAGAALASEKVIDRTAVPAPVLQAAMAKYPKATVTEAVLENDEGRSVYEIRLTAGGEKVDLKFDAAGKLISEERPIALNAMPPPVLVGLSSSHYGDWQVKKLERVENFERPDRSGFEALVEKKGKQRELLFSSQGKLLMDAEEGDAK
jgi:hypothetical protein